MNLLPPDLDDSDRALLQQASMLLRSEFPDGLSRAGLRRINDQRGVDFATAVLYSHFTSKLSDRWQASDAATDSNASRHAQPRTIVIAPGAFYKEYPQIGADGRQLTENVTSHNLHCRLIPTASLGNLDQNAETIVQWFDRQDLSNVVLLSLSKGAADVKIALQNRPDLWNRIDAWVSVSGILHGTKIANWLLERKRLWLARKFLLWYRKLKRESLVELRHNSDTRRRRENPVSRLAFTMERTNHYSDCDDPILRDPVQVVGFPLVKHLSGWRARLWHRRFRRDGPNDGVMLLEDLLDQPGTVLPIWGADHYMKSAFDTSGLLARIIDQATYRSNETGEIQSHANG